MKRIVVTGAGPRGFLGWHKYWLLNSKCALSGIDIKFYNRAEQHLTTASLDRIDSNKPI
ncbi:hypothetical protein LCGC14_0426960 [marine sediment metagenome]|uniref:Uncharacterized protein n=1 Tax=marine sediment metagenome TaxID=412755 RepID=A0A0F9SVG3_9ZZZZ